MRAKWLGERFTRPARSAIATGSFLCAHHPICYSADLPRRKYPIRPIVEARGAYLLRGSGFA